jgi:hypothetical protein
MSVATCSSPKLAGRCSSPKLARSTVCSSPKISVPCQKPIGLPASYDVAWGVKNIIIYTFLLFSALKSTALLLSIFRGEHLGLNENNHHLFNYLTSIIYTPVLNDDGCHTCPAGGPLVGNHKKA